MLSGRDPRGRDPTRGSVLNAAIHSRSIGAFTAVLAGMNRLLTQKQVHLAYVARKRLQCWRSIGLHVRGSILSVKLRTSSTDRRENLFSQRGLVFQNDAVGRNILHTAAECGHTGIFQAALAALRLDLDAEKVNHRVLDLVSHDTPAFSFAVSPTLVRNCAWFRGPFRT